MVQVTKEEGVGVPVVEGVATRRLGVQEEGMIIDMKKILMNLK
jgi:hypothetical protein